MIILAFSAIVRVVVRRQRGLRTAASYSDYMIRAGAGQKQDPGSGLNPEPGFYLFLASIKEQFVDALLDLEPPRSDHLDHAILPYYFESLHNCIAEQYRSYQKLL